MRGASEKVQRRGRSWCRLVWSGARQTQGSAPSVRTPAGDALRTHRGSLSAAPQAPTPAGSPPPLEGWAGLPGSRGRARRGSGSKEASAREAGRGSSSPDAALYQFWDPTPPGRTATVCSPGHHRFSSSAGSPEEAPRPRRPQKSRHPPDGFPATAATVQTGPCGCFTAAESRPLGPLFRLARGGAPRAAAPGGAVRWRAPPSVPRLTSDGRPRAAPRSRLRDQLSRARSGPRVGRLVRAREERAPACPDAAPHARGRRSPGTGAGAGTCPEAGQAARLYDKHTGRRLFGSFPKSLPCPSVNFSRRSPGRHPPAPNEHSRSISRTDSNPRWAWRQQKGLTGVGPVQGARSRGEEPRRRTPLAGTARGAGPPRAGGRRRRGHATGSSGEGRAVGPGPVRACAGRTRRPRHEGNLGRGSTDDARGPSSAARRREKLPQGGAGRGRGPGRAGRPGSRGGRRRRPPPPLGRPAAANPKSRASQTSRDAVR
ncbi:translation initiation factor IF-2-like [Zalophus californianus]|uniref:Translation initiation factor IF-2-like n=1 Tax=Zalophus californianus TaxID=9704 RepID=A0A6P9FFH7_ZALCA|nr:translation initiation factor IF-2-like [Zalophus californianus]